MKPIAAVRDYHYWSERLVTKLWQDNVTKLPDKINVSFGNPSYFFGVESQSQDTPDTRAARASAVEELLSDQIVADLDYAGPTIYLAGQSQVVLSSLRNPSGTDSGAVMLFGRLTSTEGATVSLCLFGSAKNVCDYEPEVPLWRKFGWTSSTNEGVRVLLSAAPNAESEDDPAAHWLASAEQHEAGVGEICKNAENICVGQGQYHAADVTSWHRGFTLGHYLNAEWLARIYFTHRRSGKQLPNAEESDVIHVGSALWLRTPNPRAWVPYTVKSIPRLDAARHSPLERPYAWAKYRYRGKHLEHVRHSKNHPEWYED